MPERAQNRTRKYLVIGILLSVVWASIIGWYLFSHIGWDTLKIEEFNEVGDFMAGAFAPLAFAWFVLALLIQSEQLKLQSAELSLQREELAAQRKELAEAVEQAEAQAKGIQAYAEHSAKATFLQLSQVFERDLKHYAGYINSLVKENIINETKIFGQHFFEDEKYIFNDEYGYFARCARYFSLGGNINFIMESGNKRPIPQARRYIRVFEKLLFEVDKVDDNRQNLRREYEWCPMGHLYSELTKLPGIRRHELLFAHRARTENNRGN